MRNTREVPDWFITLVALLLMFTGANFANAQTDISSLIGEPAHARVLPVRFGQANLDTGDLHLEIPLYSVPERGLPPNTIRLVYDSFFWAAIPPASGIPTLEYPSGTGWSIQSGDIDGGVGGAVAEPATVTQCSAVRYGDYGTITVTNYWDTVDAHGTQHRFDLYAVRNNCTLSDGRTPDTGSSPQSSGGQAYALDGTGYHLTVASDGITATVLAPDGTSNGGTYTTSGGITTTLSGSESPNGNVYGYSVSGPGTYTAYDELGGPQAFTWNSFCSGPNGSSLAITVPNTQVPANQPYRNQTPVSCVATMPAWNAATQSATTAQYTFVYDYEPVCEGSSSSDYCGGMWELHSVSIPEIGIYTFAYDTGTSGMHIGLLNSITMPTGGTVSYQYGTGPSGTIINTVPFVTSVTDVGGATTISYANNSAYPFPETITFPPHPSTPAGTTMIQDKRTITNAATQQHGYGPYTIDDYSGSTLIQSTVETRDSANRVTSVASTWTATGEGHTVNLKYADDPSVPGYQSYGGVPINLIAQKAEYDSGALIRTLTTQYMKDTSAIHYISQYNMITYPLSQTLQDGGGNTVAQTLYTYDEYSASYCQSSYPAGLSGIPMLTSVTGASGHDDSHGTSYLARGNVTTMQRMISSGVLVSTHSCYDTVGNVLQTVDGNNHATRYSYQDGYLDTACITAGNPTYGFPSVATDALGHQTKTGYYTCNRAPGQVQSPNDVNNGSKGTQTTYDIAGRILCVTSPDGGQTCTSYPSADEVDRTILINAQTTDKIETILDEYGRTVNLIDTGAGSEVDTSYDLLDHVNCVTNPYFTTAGGSSAPKTCYAYDVLSRVTGILYADGTSRLTNAYNGNTTTTTDPDGNEAKKKTDAAGRVTYVWEPASPNTTPAIETDYSYDALNNLTQITQWGGPNGSTGARTRSFSYDGLSRLIEATNPESATVCYGIWSNGACTSDYDANGNLIAKTDARGVVTWYAYDSLNRLLSKTYSNAPTGAASSCYQYDSVANGTGLLGAEWTQAGSCPSSPPTTGYQSLRKIGGYDLLGRVVSEQQCVAGYCTSTTVPSAPSANCTSLSGYNGLQYCYDLAGNLLAFSSGVTTASAGSYPQAAMTFLQTFDSGGRLATLISSWSDSTHPPNLFNGQAYTPSNALSSWFIGPHILAGRTYDTRLRVTGQTGAQQ